MMITVEKDDINKSYLTLGLQSLTYLEHLKNMGVKVNCAVWDPPYHDPGSEMDRQGNPKSGTIGNSLQVAKDYIIMDPFHRELIYQALYDILEPDSVIIHFGNSSHAKYETIEHIWYKGDYFTNGGFVISNSENIYLERIGNFKPNKHPGLFRVINIRTEGVTRNLGPGKTIWTATPRMCAKPQPLYERLFKHVNATSIVDPFAGWGRSISAAKKLKLAIYANDIDESLIDQWAYYTYSKNQDMEAFFK